MIENNRLPRAVIGKTGDYGRRARGGGYHALCGVVDVRDRDRRGVSTGTVDNIVGNRLACAPKPQEFNALHSLHKL
jgi:hypothetical protein